MLFVSGTRADFGKLKPLIRSVDESTIVEYALFVTGMHTLSRYGNTIQEVYKEGFRNVHAFINQTDGEAMDLVLANTVQGLGRYVHEHAPDMIVVHGDRIETLAAAIVGTLNNTLVGHIEGGELSGTVDGIIRHAVSKLAHIHFVSNSEAAARLVQLGEGPSCVYVIGSPDIDIMLSDKLPGLNEAKSRYGITFMDYGIVVFHPVTTERDQIATQADVMVEALLESHKNYIVVYPNNDPGADRIIAAYDRLIGNPRFRLFPSIRFEYYLTLLKHASFIIGNSSSGIHEAPVYGRYTINLGSRQDDRFPHASILNVGFSKEEIARTIRGIDHKPRLSPCYHFGSGDSAIRFRSVIEQEAIWRTPRQKKFYDLDMKQDVGGGVLSTP